jgi:uncharacterized repeat protein (TIGR03806 family)
MPFVCDAVLDCFASPLERFPMSRFAPFIWVLFVVFTSATLAAEPVRKPFGIEQRELWTTGNIHGTPEPPDPYRIENAFPRLKLFEPLAVDVAPRTKRFGVATRPGKIYTFEIRPDVEEAELLVDVGRTVYGLAFHPRFQENGYFYVTSLVDPNTAPKGSRVSRFQVSKRGALTADPATEKVIFEWPSGGHNGGCIRFGPDGYLYLATGDGSGIADWLETGQKIDDVLGAILRIDVDHADRELPYSIPKDNPFVGRQDARGEIWSFGHRQIWKFAFDPPTGRMWAGEVGQDLWEMIYLIRRGGNYGWSVMEGRYPFRPQREKGPGEFEQPIVEHPHSDFRSITGGYVYRSERLPELNGAYIYGDYDTGKLWMLRCEDRVAGSEPGDAPARREPAGASKTQPQPPSNIEVRVVTEHRQLADTQIRIVEFAQDPAGEVYAVDFAGGGFYRLVPAPAEVEAKPFPRWLSETGLFASTKEHRPAKGLIPYSVNSPLWSDGAEKERFIALPGDSQIEVDDVVYPHGPQYADPGWRFPDGAVLVKTFSLDMQAGDPSTRRRLETRILQHRKMPGNDDEYGAQYWFGYTYVWNEEQSDAELLAAEGLDREYLIRDAAAEGGERKVNWRFPSRTECALCHTMAAKYVLGVTTLQMNKDHDYGGVVANQLATLEHLGVFKEPLEKRPANLPRLVDYHDDSQDLHLRARSYLHSNCAHCHRIWGGGNAEFELHASIPLTETKALDARPGQGDFALNDPRIIAPGDPDRSLILHRMQLTSLGRMPHIASRVVDEDAVELLREWILKLHEEELLARPGAANPPSRD